MPGINAKHLRKYVVRPTLKFMGWHSQAAEELLMGTAAVESNLGEYLHQIRGPAQGIFQMEPATHKDIWENYLAYRKPLADSIKMMGAKCTPDEAMGNLYYAAAMARVHYIRQPQALPAADDLPGLAAYWKQYYNTPKGRGTTQGFIDAYLRLVKGD